MFRSSERRAALLALTIALLACPAATALADESSPPVTDPMPRVLNLKPRVVELRSRESDLSGAATVARRPSRIDVTLNSNVMFAKDSATLLPAATKRLAEVGTELAGRAPGSLTITGYTDDLGSAEHGLVLSRQRAEAVNKALAPHLSGISVTVAGKGEADPAVPNKDEKSRAQNRRVELHFTKK